MFRIHSFGCVFCVADLTRDVFGLRTQASLEEVFVKVVTAWEDGKPIGEGEDENEGGPEELERE